MTEAPVWGIVFATILVLTSLTFFSLADTWTRQTNWVLEAGRRQEAHLGSALAIQAARGVSTNCSTFTSPFKARVDNTGVRPVSDLSQTDLLVDYTGSGGSKVVSRLTHGSGWSVNSISPDLRGPNLWDPQETATIHFTLSQALASGSNGTLVLATPQGAADSAYFSCIPPISTGFLSPTAQSADTGGDGDGFEVNPTNAFADDAFYAENVKGDGDRHRFYNYGFSIPSGREIFGIEVRLDWWLLDFAGTNSLSVELSWNGGASWTTAKTDAVESLTERTVVLGSSSDTWGRAWSPSDFSDANFRVRVTANGFVVQTFFLDWVPVNVYYEPEL